MSDGKVVYEVRADDSKVGSDLDLANSKVEKGASKIGGAAKSIAATVGKAIAATAVAAGAAAVAFTAKGMSVASDLTEVQNVVDVAFGSMSKDVDDWAKTATNAYGLSTLAAKQYTGTMGAMLKSQGIGGDQMTDMSTKLAGLAGDFASFYNLSTDDAWEKIRAGISGETMPLKELGINMDQANLDAFALKQGLKETYLQMDQQNQTLLRFNYLMSVSSDAQGDFTRTSGSWANLLRTAKLNLDTLSASIGNQLIPAFSGVVGAFNKAVEDSGGDFNAFIDNFDSIIEAGQQAAAKIMPVITSLANKILDAFVKMLPQLLDMGGDIVTSLANGVSRAMPKIGDALGRIAAKLIKELPQLISAAYSGAASAMKGLIYGLFGLVDPMEKVNDQIQSLAQDASELNEQIDESKKSFEKTTAEIDANATAAGKLADTLYALEQKENKSNADKAEMKGLVKQLNDMYGDLNLILDENTGKLNLNADAVKNVIQAEKDEATAKAYLDLYTKSLTDQAVAKKAMGDAQDAYNKKLQDYASMTGSTVDQIKSLIKTDYNTWDYFQDAQQLIDSTGKTYDKATDAVNYYSDAMDKNTKSQAANIAAAKAANTAESEYLKSLDDWNSKVEAAQQKHEDAMGSIYDYGLKKQKISMAQAAKNIRKQISDQISYDANMKKLQAEVTPEVYAQLAGEGTKAAGLIAALVKKPKNKKEAKAQQNLINAEQEKANYTWTKGQAEVGAAPNTPAQMGTSYSPPQSTKSTNTSVVEAFAGLRSYLDQVSSTVAGIPDAMKNITVNIDDATIKRMPTIQVTETTKTNMMLDDDVIGGIVTTKIKEYLRDHPPGSP